MAYQDLIRPSEQGHGKLCCMHRVTGLKLEHSFNMVTLDRPADRAQVDDLVARLTRRAIFVHRLATQHQGQRVDQLPVEMASVPPSVSLITWVREPRARTQSGSGRQEASAFPEEQPSSRSVSSHAGSSIGTPIQLMVSCMSDEEKMVLLATILSSTQPAEVSNTQPRR
jgi:hypothetical protein